MYKHIVFMVKSHNLNARTLLCKIRTPKSKNDFTISTELTKPANLISCKLSVLFPKIIVVKNNLISKVLGKLLILNLIIPDNNTDIIFLKNTFINCELLSTCPNSNIKFESEIFF